MRSSRPWNAACPRRPPPSPPSRPSTTKEIEGSAPDRPDPAGDKSAVHLGANPFRQGEQTLGGGVRLSDLLSGGDETEEQVAAASSTSAKPAVTAGASSSLVTATRDQVLAEFDRTYEEVQSMLAERMAEAGLAESSSPGAARENAAKLEEDMALLVDDLQTLKSLCDGMSRRVSDLIVRCRRVRDQGGPTA
ncbi:MAG: hypothetical protein ACYTDX_06185 [Planctomycetota bacterium]